MYCKINPLHCRVCSVPHFCEENNFWLFSTFVLWLVGAAANLALKWHGA